MTPGGQQPQLGLLRGAPTTWLGLALHAQDHHPEHHQHGKPVHLLAHCRLRLEASPLPCRRSTTGWQVALLGHQATTSTMERQESVARYGM